jgi:16S rRNA (adenine1518-N6/adenine1519-N6)-dimethyltransferase
MHRMTPETPQPPELDRDDERLPSARQTHSYLRDLMEKRGLHPKNKLGQNFLIDLNLLDLIVRRAELTYDDLALEVGSGTGGLTARLVEVSGAVVSVEIDPAFAGMVREVIPKNPRVVLMRADALKNKNELNPDVLKVMKDLQQLTGTTRVKLVANLPYAVATPVICNLLLTDLPVERMIVTVQLEIADRLMASPGTKEYGALAVLVQSLADVWMIRRLPPTVFWPRPKVWSAIVGIRPGAAKRARVGDVVRFRNFLRDLYTHRRKNLRGGLVGSPSRDFSKAEVDRKLAALGIEGTVRAEDLDVRQHLRLCEAFA